MTAQPRRHGKCLDKLPGATIAGYDTGTRFCDLEHGHGGAHESGGTSWVLHDATPPSDEPRNRPAATEEDPVSTELPAPLTDVDYRLHALNLAVACVRDRIRLSLKLDDGHPDEYPHRVIADAVLYAAYLRDGTVPAPLPVPETAAEGDG